VSAASPTACTRLAGWTRSTRRRELPQVGAALNMTAQSEDRAQDRAEKLSFGEIARRASNMMGSGWAFMLACTLIAVWALTGPLFGYSDAWQLVVNTGTTIVTFLMVFLIQNTQNRDARAVHLKLDELIRSVKAARNRLIDLEDCTDEELDQLQQEFEKLKKQGPRTPLPRRAGPATPTLDEPAESIRR
jgi:low affinity Fe/Cu permease